MLHDIYYKTITMSIKMSNDICSEVHRVNNFKTEYYTVNSPSCVLPNLVQTQMKGMQYPVSFSTQPKTCKDTKNRLYGKIDVMLCSHLMFCHWVRHLVTNIISKILLSCPGHVTQPIVQ